MDTRPDARDAVAPELRKRERKFPGLVTRREADCLQRTAQQLLQRRPEGCWRRGQGTGPAGIQVEPICGFLFTRRPLLTPRGRVVVKRGLTIDSDDRRPQAAALS